MSSVTETMIQAITGHQAGHFREAERLYKEILNNQPDYDEALFLLGLLAQQEGRLAEARNFIERALVLRPDHADYLNGLGTVLADMDLKSEAIDVYQRAIQADSTIDEYYLNLGNVYQAQENHEAAIRQYQQALRINPDSADTYNNIAGAQRALKRNEDAIESYKRAISLRPDFYEAYFNLAGIYGQLNENDTAIEYYHNTLSINPDFTAAHLNLGLLYVSMERTEDAYKIFQDTLARFPEEPQLYEQLGQLYLDQNQPDKALEIFSQALSRWPEDDMNALRLATALFFENCLPEAEALLKTLLQNNPGNSKAHCQMGNVMQESGRYPEAERHYLESLRLDNDQPEVCFHLATLMQMTGRLTEAIRWARKLLIYDPEFMEGYGLLGALYFKTGDLANAKNFYLGALKLQPHLPKAHYNLGSIYFLGEKAEPAISHFKQALVLQPDYEEALDRLGLVYQQSNQPEKAMECYRKAYDLTGKDAYKVKMLMTLPCIYTSFEDITQWRSNLQDALNTLNRDGISIGEPVQEIGQSNFYLAYQGCDDKSLQMEFARLFANLPNFSVFRPPEPIAGRKIRIGFISRFFQKQHTIGKLFQGLIHNLCREQFSVTVFDIHDPVRKGEMLSFQPEDTWISLPDNNLEAASRKIAAQELDILFYPDIGMDPCSYFLAFSRLAPVQCVSWGHPDTTGIPTIDYFVSSEALELPQCQEFYTEQVVLPKNMLCYATIPNLPEELKKTKKDFGFSESDHLYVCTQSLFKIHPDFDEALLEILRRDPAGKAIFLQGHYGALAQSLLRRWEKIMPEMLDRIFILDRLNQRDFLSLQACADVLLDTFHINGGNTTIEALTFGTPVVTMPTRFLRGRLTYGCYRQIGVMDCVTSSVAEYVEIALRLGNDPAYRKEIQAKISAAAPKLFSNLEYVREMEAFFKEAITKAARPEEGVPS